MADAVIESLQQQITALDQQIVDAKVLAESDASMAELVVDEIKSLEAQKQALTDSINQISGNFTKVDESDPDSAYDNCPAILEVRGGAGGEEAKIFADDLIRMYLKYAENHKMKYELIDEGVFKIRGHNAYGIFKYEAGVHRVQRVPETESSGRIHTSTASVAVLPEVPPTQITVREEDLIWKFTTSGGHGGQNVNKVATAVLLTHKPSGFVVNCRQERYQQQNREIALELLRAHLWEIEEEKRLSKLTEKRRNAVGTAARSEKIRTYNFPQTRVTDHRIKKSWHNLHEILGGYLDEVTEALQNPASPAEAEGEGWGETPDEE
jgi:peptide chain release factor 1